MAIKFLKIRVYGRVQGVFFRSSAQEKFKELNLKGFAKNEPETTVYIEVEGEEKNLNKFLEWCQKGPPLAKVEKIEYEYLPYQSEDKTEKKQN